MAHTSALTSKDLFMISLPERICDAYCPVDEVTINPQNLRGSRLVGAPYEESLTMRLDVKNQTIALPHADLRGSAARSLRDRSVNSDGERQADIEHR